MEPSIRPAWRRPALIGGGAALAAAAAAVGAAIMLGGAGEARPSRADGPAIQIALFQAEEPEIQAGEVMDVGAVVDGYQHRPPAPAEPYLETAWLEEPAPYDPDLVAPLPREEDVARITVNAAGPPPAAERRPLDFFDGPRADYAEARRQRRIEMDRRMAAREAQEQARVYDSGPRPYPDYRPADAFY